MPPLMPTTKPLFRSVRKAAAKYGGDLSRVCDVVRARVLLVDLDEVMEALRYLRDAEDDLVSFNAFNPSKLECSVNL